MRFSEVLNVHHHYISVPLNNLFPYEINYQKSLLSRKRIINFAFQTKISSAPLNSFINTMIHISKGMSGGSY